MRQEQALTKKRLNVDYMKTYEHNIANIYFNLKRFQYNNNELIIKYNTKSKKKHSDDDKYIIDKSYIKMLDKIDELLN